MKKSSSAFVIPKLDRSVEELVLQARLRVIEKEHKSVGTILDKRSMQTLDEIAPNPFKNGQNDLKGSTTIKSLLSNPSPPAVPQSESDANIAARRGAVGGSEVDDESRRAVEAALNVNSGTGLAGDGVGSLADEEMIWRSKASNPNYTLKRKYNHPELAEFFENMTLDQKGEFKKKCYEIFLSIVLKLRNECAKLKRDMDYAGIFHPSANAQRAHCIYIGKLQKMIEAQNIEDVAIRSMRNAVIERERQEAEEEEKRNRLIKLAEQSKKKGGLGVIEPEALLDNVNGDEATAPPAEVNGVKEVDDLEGKERGRISSIAAGGRGGNDSGKVEKKGDKKIDKKVDKKVDKESLGISKKSSEKTLVAIEKGKSSSIINDPAAMKKAGSLNKAEMSKKIQESESSLLGGERKDTIGNSGSNNNSNNNINNNSNNNNNIDEEKEEKEERLNSKMDHASEKMFSKIKRGKLGTADPREILTEEFEKLNYVERNLTKKKYSDHSDVLDTEMMRFIISNLQEAQIHKLSDGEQVVSNQKANAPYSSDQIVSFDEFYEMFNKYASQVGIDDLPNNTSQKVQIPSPAPNDKQSIQRHNSLANIAISNSMLPNNNISSTTYSTTHDMNISNNILSSSSGTDLNERAIAKDPIDLIAAMSAKDEHFEAFLKLSLREKPTGRRLFNPNQKKLLKPTKIRNVPPLGEDCMKIKSIVRGKKLEAMATGFTNHFKSTTGTWADDNQEDDHDDESSTSRVTEEGQSLTGEESGEIGNLLTTGTNPSATLSNSNAVGTINLTNTMNTMNKSMAISANESDANINSTQSLPTPKTPKLVSRAKSRRTLIRSKSAVVDESSSGKEENGTRKDVSFADIQSKLTMIWNILQYPHSTKLQFMRKYSTDSYATQLPYCVHLWSIAAFLVVAKLQLIKLRKKVDLDYAVYPLASDELLSSIKKNFPLDLEVADGIHGLNFFNPSNGIPYDNIESISDVTSRVYDEIQNIYDSYLEGVLEPSQGRALVKDLKTLIDDKLLYIFKKAYDDIDDVLLFQTFPLKDWINSDVPAASAGLSKPAL